MSNYKQEELEYNITETMLKYGGGFVQQLAILYRKGDPQNKLKLRLAFQDYWLEYKKMYEENK